MKSHVILSIVMLMVVGTASGFEIPRSVFKMDELDKAKEKATKSGKPLVFVYSNRTTRWGPCIVASVAALKEFDRAGVLVYADVKESNSLPAGVKEVRAKGGSTIPMVFVTSSDGTKGLEGIPNTKLKGDIRDTVRDLRKSLKEKAGDDKPGGLPPRAEEKDEEHEMLSESQEWTNVAGKTMKAAVKYVGDEKVFFVMPSGKTLGYKLSELSDESRERIEALKK